MNDNKNKDIALQGLVNDIKTIINTARTFAVRSDDFCRVQMYLAFSKYVARNMQLTNVADTDINWELLMMVEQVVCLDVVKFLASHYFYKK